MQKFTETSQYTDGDCDVWQCYRETSKGIYLTTVWRIPGRYLAQRTRNIMEDSKIVNRLITWRRAQYGIAPATERTAIEL